MIAGDCVSEDADFIAHARQDIPDLLACVAELERTVDAMEGFRMEAVCQGCKQTFGAHSGYGNLCPAPHKGEFQP
jgi:hypothetical protein